jgi:WD40 repeat protein
MLVTPSPDGKTVAVLVPGAAGSFSLRLVDAASGAVRHAFDFREPVTAAAFHPDGKVLAAGTISGRTHLWEFGTAGVPRVLQHPDTKPDRIKVETQPGVFVEAPAQTFGSVDAMAFSRDGGTLLVGGGLGVGQLWDPATGKEKGEKWVHGQTMIRAVGFTRDGTTALLAGLDNRVSAWEVATGKPLGTVAADTSVGLAAGIALSPSGRHAALAGGKDQTVLLWREGKRVGRPLAHPRRVLLTAFCPQEKALATVDETGAVRLWDVATGLPLGPPVRDQGFVQAVAFTPEGGHLLIGGATGATSWELPRPASGGVKELVAWTRYVTGLELTRDGEVRKLAPGAWEKLRGDIREPQADRATGSR